MGFLLLTACETSGNAPAGSGGWTSSGGSSSAGGARTGGSTGSGGSASGGTTNSGGSMGSGGAPSGGGSTASGGSNNNGGARTGGATNSGGSMGSGGVFSGGNSAGGTSSAGGGGAGATNSGGKPSSGGTTSSGGAGAGGSSAAGGSTGGSSARDGGGPDVLATDTVVRNDAAGACTDDCPAPKGGLTIGCKKRFVYGANFAWKNFACDFGGKASWSMNGVAADKATYTTAIQEMKDSGVDVIRWWMFPDLRGDGIQLDDPTTRNPTGLGATVIDDVNAALAIAAEQNVHIRLTLFSFDNFRADSADSPGTGPIVTDATKRGLLMSKVVGPIARAVEASPNKDRMIAWDVINEPEWATSGQDPYGDQAFDAQSNLAFITYAQMETFIKDTVVAIKAESKAPVTVGSAAVKWAKAWSQCGLDYHDFHWYGWVDQYYPHTKTPADYLIDDQPVVVGEFPFTPSADTTGQAFGGITYNQLVTDFLNAGYAGAMGWAFSDAVGAFNWATAQSSVKAWADAHTCYTHY
jgi:hypothetical protein